MENSYSNPYSSAQYGPQGSVAVPKAHSLWGIASFLLSCFAGLLLIGSIGAIVYLEATPSGGLEANRTAAAITGLCVVGALGLFLIAAVFGLVGLFESNRKRLFAVLGLLFSSMALLGTIGLIVLGVMVG